MTPTKEALRAARAIFKEWDVGDHSGSGGCIFDSAQLDEVATLIDHHTLLPELLAVAEAADYEPCRCILMANGPCPFCQALAALAAKRKELENKS